MTPEWLIISAFRYALGRATGVVDDMAQYLIDNQAVLSEWAKGLIVKEIREAFYMDRAGMDMDRQRWTDVLEELGGDDD